LIAAPLNPLEIYEKVVRHADLRECVEDSESHVSVRMSKKTLKRIAQSYSPYVGCKAVIDFFETVFEMAVTKRSSKCTVDVVCRSKTMPPHLGALHDFSFGFLVDNKIVAYENIPIVLNFDDEWRYYNI
jgi:hypothetical protein